MATMTQAEINTIVSKVERIYGEHFTNVLRTSGDFVTKPLEQMPYVDSQESLVEYLRNRKLKIAELKAELVKLRGPLLTEIYSLVEEIGIK